MTDHEEMSRERRLDYLKSRMLERGFCRAATLNVVEINEIVDSLGLDPNECYIDVSGWLYQRGMRDP